MRPITEKVSVLLSDEQVQALQDFIYELISDSINRAKRDAGISQKWLRKGVSAKYAGVSIGTFSTWVKNGLPGRVINGTTLFNKNDIDSYINHNGKRKK